MSEVSGRTLGFEELQREMTEARQKKLGKSQVQAFLRPGEEIAAVEAIICPECGGSVAKGSRSCVSCHTDLYNSAPGDEENRIDSAVEAARLREQRLPAHMVDVITKMPVNVGDLVMLSFYYFVPFELDVPEEAQDKEWMSQVMTQGRKSRILPLVSVTEPESALVAGIIKERRRVAGHFKPYRLHKVNGQPHPGLCLSSGKLDEQGQPYSEFEFYEPKHQTVSMGRVWRQYELRTGVSLVERRKDSNEVHYQLDRNARPELITTSRGHMRSDNKLINQASRPEDGIDGVDDWDTPLVTPLSTRMDPEAVSEQEPTKTLLGVVKAVPPVEKVGARAGREL